MTKADPLMAALRQLGQQPSDQASIAAERVNHGHLVAEGRRARARSRDASGGTGLSDEIAQT